MKGTHHGGGRLFATIRTDTYLHVYLSLPSKDTKTIHEFGCNIQPCPHASLHLTKELASQPKSIG